MEHTKQGWLTGFTVFFDERSRSTWLTEVLAFSRLNLTKSKWEAAGSPTSVGMEMQLAFRDNGKRPDGEKS